MVDAGQDAPRRIAPERWMAIAAFALGALPYANAIHGAFVFDDITLIVNNDIVKDPHRISELFFTNLWGFAGRTSTYYRPLPPLLFMALQAVFGMHPEPFHAANILLHGLASSLVFGITSALLARAHATVATARWSALAAAAVFAVHPIHTEAVTWISGVMDVACTAFSLLALYLYVTSEGRGRPWRGALLVPLALLLGLFSKEPAAVVPFLIVGYDFLFNRERIGKPLDAVRRWAPPFGALGVYLAFRVVALGGFAPHDHAVRGWSAAAVLMLPRLFALYVQKLVAPVGLTVIYVLKPVTAASPEFFGAMAVVVAMGGAAALAWTRGATVAIFGLLLFMLPLAPSLYIPALNQELSGAFAERYAYFPSAGAAVLVGAVLAAVGERNRRLYGGGLAAAAVAVAVLSVMTVARNAEWRDSLALWSDGVRKSPDSAAAHENLGLALIRQGRECEGRRELRAALKLAPDRAVKTLESGMLAAQAGLTLQAILSMQTALLFDPDLVDGHYNLALAFEQLGWNDAAIAQYRETLARSADRADAHNNLGILLAGRNGLDEAIEHFKAAVGARPADRDFHLNLARAYDIKGLAAEAAEERALAGGGIAPPVPLRSSHDPRRP